MVLAEQLANVLCCCSSPGDTVASLSKEISLYIASSQSRLLLTSPSHHWPAA